MIHDRQLRAGPDIATEIAHISLIIQHPEARLGCLHRRHRETYTVRCGAVLQPLQFLLMSLFLMRARKNAQAVLTLVRLAPDVLIERAQSISLRAALDWVPGEVSQQRVDWQMDV